jgi:hypothetical protein
MGFKRGAEVIVLNVPPLDEGSRTPAGEVLKQAMAVAGV